MCMRHHLQLFCLFLLLSVISPIHLSAEHSMPAPLDSSRVLILHSYHKGLKWTDGQEDAIRKALLVAPHLEIYTEYLNTKRKLLKDISKEALHILKEKGT